MRIINKRFTHLGGGMHKDLETGKMFDAEHLEEKSTFKVVGEIGPNRFR